MSIVGEALAPEINGQIKIRQEKYGLQTRTNEDLLYYNTKTAFVKLISSVDITSAYQPTSPELKTILSQIQGSQLAKDFVLFNGVSEANTDPGKSFKSKLRSGVAKDNSILSNKAYGLGGTEYGLNPMPGILNASIKTENRGSLKTGTVKIKAYNKTQFEIIDILYLRLGYSILLEWGNTVYFKNDGSFINGNPHSLQNIFLLGKLDTQGILKAIAQLRLDSNGNYDALYGKVVNFNWELLDDGTYDITLIVRSIGDVIESLKLNTLTSGLNELEFSGQSWFDDLKILPPNAIMKMMSGLRQIIIDFQPFLRTQPNNTRRVTKDSAPQFNPNSRPAAFLPGAGTLKFAGYGCYTFSGGDITGDKDEDDRVNFINQVYKNVDTIEDNYYIRLGFLLKFIEKRVLPKYSGKTPLLNFDTDPETNLCYLIKGGNSLNPDICLLSQKIIYPSTGNEYNYAAGAETYIATKNDVKLGKIMNIYLNQRYVIQCLKECLNPANQNTLFVDFINMLLKGVTGAMGGYNQFEFVIEEETNTGYILDQFSLPERNGILQSLNRRPGTQNTIIQLYGYNKNSTIYKGSIVRHFGMKTSITPELATIITIGAQAAGTAANTDATGISKLNQGFKDRIKPTVTDATVSTTQNTTTADRLKELDNQYPDVWKTYNSYNTNLGVKTGETDKKPLALFFYVNSDQVPYTAEAGQQAAANLAQYSLAKSAIENDSASGTLGFIPVSVDLTLDGISGIKIYNTLSVDTRYLPSNYPRTMDFIITGITHNIINNDWNTVMSTVMVPNPKNVEIDIPSTGGSPNSSPGGGSAPQGGGSTDESTWPKTITSGYPLNPDGHDVSKTYPKTQIVIHYTAGSQKNDNAKYEVGFLNKRHQRSANSSQGIDEPPLGLSYHYIITSTGHVEQLLPDTARAFHASSANSNSIGISLENYGYCKDADNSSYGKMGSTQTRGVKMVDADGKEAAYRGYEYAQEVTDAQITALTNLLKTIKANNKGIPSYSWQGKPTFDRLFPDKSTTTYSSGVPGIYTHCSITTSKKDCLPTPKMINFFKTLKL